jgi:sugar phosphate isomerase/epimerase
VTRRFALAVLLAAPLAAADAPSPFFAFDNGTGRDQKVPLAEQADLIQRAGYAGIGFTGTQRIPELLRILDARGLRLFSIYVACRVDKPEIFYDPGLREAIGQLKGRGTAIWLTVQGKPVGVDGDERTVRTVREIADLAAPAGLRVVLYHHHGFYVDHLEHALRLRQRAGRPNIGVSFNLAHLLASGDEPHLDRLLAAALPHLDLVSINGADRIDPASRPTADWSRLIQTLDRGDYDVRGVMRRLWRLGYKGPVGLQGYQVKGDIQDNLQRSMRAWRIFIKP